MRCKEIFGSFLSDDPLWVLCYVDLLCVVVFKVCCEFSVVGCEYFVGLEVVVLRCCSLVVLL
jgi:hypothetical protein